MPLTYTNPRLRATIDNWPMGGNKRGTAFFSIEVKTGKGERGVRVTKTDDSPMPGKPKFLTFTRKARIVDGDDGKTYIAELSRYGFISIMQSNMQFEQESIHTDAERYPALLTLFTIPAEESPGC
jgi:hypothetical protein